MRVTRDIDNNLALNITARWPSGLRRQTQVTKSLLSDNRERILVRKLAGVRIPLLSTFSCLFLAPFMYFFAHRFIYPLQSGEHFWLSVTGIEA
jgi:hypothetical protein